MAILITSIGSSLEKFWIAQLGSAVAMLGLNALVSYLDYAFSESEEREIKRRKREKIKNNIFHACVREKAENKTQK